MQDSSRSAGQQRAEVNGRGLYPAVDLNRLLLLLMMVMVLGPVTEPQISLHVYTFTANY